MGENNRNTRAVLPRERYEIKRNVFQ